MQQFVSHCLFVGHQANQIEYCCVSNECSQNQRTFCNQCRQLHHKCVLANQVYNELQIKDAIQKRIGEIINQKEQLKIVVQLCDNLKKVSNSILEELQYYLSQVLEKPTELIQIIYTLNGQKQPLLQSSQIQQILNLLQAKIMDQEFNNYKLIVEQRINKVTEKLTSKLRSILGQTQHCFDSYKDSQQNVINYEDQKRINVMEFKYTQLYKMTNVSNLINARLQKNVILISDTYGQIIIFSQSQNKVLYKMQSNSRITSFDFLKENLLFAGDKLGNIFQAPENNQFQLKQLKKLFDGEVKQISYNVQENTLVCSSQTEICMFIKDNRQIIKRIMLKSVYKHNFLINGFKGVLITPNKKCIQVYKLLNFKLIIDNNLKLDPSNQLFIGMEQSKYNNNIFVHQLSTKIIQFYDLDLNKKTLNLLHQIEIKLENNMKINNISLINQLLIYETTQGIYIATFEQNSILLKFIQNQNQQILGQVKCQTDLKRLYRIQDQDILMFELIL